MSQNQPPPDDAVKLALSEIEGIAQALRTMDPYEIEDHRRDFADDLDHAARTLGGWFARTRYQIKQLRGKVIAAEKGQEHGGPDA